MITKTTKAANKALASGIESTYVKRRCQGQLCYEEMILTKNGRALIGMVDTTLDENPLYGLKVVRVKGKTAHQICRDYAQ